MLTLQVYNYFVIIDLLFNQKYWVLIRRSGSRDNLIDRGTTEVLTVRGPRDYRELTEELPEETNIIMMTEGLPKGG